MFVGVDDQCGIWYMVVDGNMSCNKYGRCPSYEELLIQRDRLLTQYLLYQHTLTQITNINAMDYEYRTWAKEALDKANEVINNENNSRL
jgi:hypothetical protein